MKRLKIVESFTRDETMQVSKVRENLKAYISLLRGFIKYTLRMPKNGFPV